MNRPTEAEPQLSHLRSLDESYLEFERRSRRIFAIHPQLEPSRYYIFRDLLIGKTPLDRTGLAKRFLRPILRRGRTLGDLNPSRVLVVVESQREVIVDAMVPLYQDLASRGVDVRLVSSGGPEGLPEPSVKVGFVPHGFSPSWAARSWRDLCETFPELRDAGLARSFYSQCAANEGLLAEVGRILERTRPELVLIASAQLSVGAAFAVACRLRGVKTVLLQHGMLQPFYIPVITDRMLTWGESSSDTLAGLGVARERLIALGSPRHDFICPSGDGSARAVLLRSLSLPDRPTFVFFSNGNDLVRNGSAPLESARWLEAVAAEYSNQVNVVVHLHPNEDGSLYRDCHRLTISKGSPPLTVLLEGADFVGSLCSTVLYDALLFRKPVWQFHAEGWPELANNWRQGLAERVGSKAELKKLIEEALQGRRKAIGERQVRSVFANHGRSTQVVADFVQRELSREVASGPFEEAPTSTGVAGASQMALDGRRVH